MKHKQTCLLNMKDKYILSIPLLIGFLLLSQIVQGQISLKTTPNSVKEICIPVTLMDTIIHDLKERKILIKKDSISKAYISMLSNDVDNMHTSVYDTEKRLLISEKKRVRNGWQRNSFIILSVLIGILCTR